MRTQVAIIGAGPAGLLLSQLLHGAGVSSVVLERHDQAHVEARIRAGLLEPATVALLKQAGIAERLTREGLVHDGLKISVDGAMLRIDVAGLTGGSRMTIYGQSEITRDLIAACAAREGPVVFQAGDVALHDIDSGSPAVSFVKDGAAQRLSCDFIAGCDGSHGVSRGSLPVTTLRTYDRAYPFGWLGILVEAPPCDAELIYANHERGFALATMRSPTRSRYYVQCAADDPLDAWPDARVWDELAVRLGPEAADAMRRGPVIEKSIAPLRSFVCEPMRHGRLFLAGDAAHIVPPTGAKGLNLAAADVKRLADGLIGYYRDGATGGLDSYSRLALARVWKAERFSWWFTGLTHRFPDMDPFSRRMQLAELDYIAGSRAAQTTLAENYVGLP